jgi:hypothetical protein
MLGLLAQCMSKRQASPLLVAPPRQRTGGHLRDDPAGVHFPNVEKVTKEWQWIATSKD